MHTIINTKMHFKYTKFTFNDILSSRCLKPEIRSCLDSTNSRIAVINWKKGNVVDKVC